MTKANKADNSRVGEYYNRVCRERTTVTHGKSASKRSDDIYVFPNCQNSDEPLRKRARYEHEDCIESVGNASSNWHAN